jgi:hypothetical protein
VQVILKTTGDSFDNSIIGRRLGLPLELFSRAITCLEHKGHTQSRGGMKVPCTLAKMPCHCFLFSDFILWLVSRVNPTDLSEVVHDGYGASLMD